MLAVLWGGLVLTLSQSSFAALLVGLAVLGGMRWSAKKAVGARGRGRASSASRSSLVAPGAIRLDLGDSKSANSATSGRYDLISGGVGLFADRPVRAGARGRSRAVPAAEHVSAERATSASHTIPITVAAEQGAIGLVAYLALLACAAVAAASRRARRCRRARASPPRSRRSLAHTMLYASFLEDPMTWTLLAVGTALAVGRRAPSARVVPPEGAPTPRDERVRRARAPGRRGVARA